MVFRLFRRVLAAPCISILLSAALTPGAEAASFIVNTAEVATRTLNAGDDLTLTGAGSVTAAPAATVLGAATFINNSGSLSSTTYGVQIDGAGTNLTGSLTNQGSATISGNTAGIFVGGGGGLSGGIVNTGLITSTGGGFGVLVSAASLAGGITNNSGASIVADSDAIQGNLGSSIGAISNLLGATISSSQNAIRAVNGSHFTGGIVNGGLVHGDASGISIESGSSITGDISNSGTVTSGNGAIQFANATFTGSLLNSAGGQIKGGNVGIIVAGTTITGGITNGGAIEGTSANGVTIQDNSSLGGNFLNNSGGTITGLNSGIAVIGTGVVITGNLVNGGTITGNAAGAVILTGGAKIAGGLTNTGTITSASESAISVTDAGSDIAGAGVDNRGTLFGGFAGVLANNGGDFSKGVANSGSIQGLLGIGGYGATINGRITNSGTVDVTDTGIFSFFSTDLKGGVVNSNTVKGGVAGIALYDASGISGGVTNTGTIAGGTFGLDLEVNSDITGGVTNAAGAVITGATGINIDTSAVSGGITSSGTITGSGGTAINMVNLTGTTRITITGGAINGAVTDSNPAAGFSIVTIAGDFTSNGNIAVSGFNVAAGKTFTLGTGNTVTSNVPMNIAGTLKGNGTVGSFVAASGGTVAPGNSIGTINVAGNVSFASGSTYQVEVDAAGNSDKIIATGTATIASGAALNIAAAPGSYGTSTYTLLTAAGGVSGTFTSVTSNLTFLSPSVGYSPTAVTLTLTQPVLFPGIAVTANQAAAATALQAGSASAGPLFLAVLNSTSTANALAAFDAASGEIHATLLASQFEAAANTRRTVLERMRRTHHDEGWSLWGTASGDWGSISGDGNAAAASRRGMDLTLGVDTPLDDHWRAGVEGGYSSGKLNLAARASSASLTGGHVGAYAWGDYGGYVIRSGFSYGFGTANTARTIAFAGFNDAATASQSSKTVLLYGEAGYDFRLQDLTIEPFMGLAWTQLNMGGFRETGGSAALAGTSRDMDNGYFTLGVQAFSRAYDLDGASLAPMLRIGWQHGFTTSPASRSLGFIAGGPSFTVLAAPLDGDRALLDAGATLALGAATQLTLGYYGALGGRANDHAVKLMGVLTL